MPQPAGFDITMPIAHTEDPTHTRLDHMPGSGHAIAISRAILYLYRPDNSSTGPLVVNVFGSGVHLPIDEVRRHTQQNDWTSSMQISSHRFDIDTGDRIPLPAASPTLLDSEMTTPSIWARLDQAGQRLRADSRSGCGWDDIRRMSLLELFEFARSHDLLYPLPDIEPLGQCSPEDPVIDWADLSKSWLEMTHMTDASTRAVIDHLMSAYLPTLADSDPSSTVPLPLYELADVQVISDCLAACCIESQPPVEPSERYGRLAILSHPLFVLAEHQPRTHTPTPTELKGLRDIRWEDWSRSLKLNNVRLKQNRYLVMGYCIVGKHYVPYWLHSTSEDDKELALFFNGDLSLTSSLIRDVS